MIITILILVALAAYSVWAIGKIRKKHKQGCCGGACECCKSTCKEK